MSIFNIVYTYQNMFLNESHISLGSLTAYKTAYVTSNENTSCLLRTRGNAKGIMRKLLLCSLKLVIDLFKE